jgi:homoserine dehydrogenase
LKIILIGCGTVGRGLLELLNEKQQLLLKRYNLTPIVTGISDPAVGQIFNDEGLDLEKILSLLSKEGHIKDYNDGITGWDSIKTIKESDADVVVEVTPTNIETGDPGLTHIKTALTNGMNVATTNKGPIALAYHELNDLALKHGCFLRFEGTVLAGTPALNLALTPLAGIEIKEIRGIMNGTTNYILTHMESGMSYEEVLKEAQEKGYAETKPDADVKGWDALAKIIISANVLMGGDLKVGEVECQGIDGISKEDVEDALDSDKHWKLIARAWREDGKIRASVLPQKLDKNDPLSRVSGVTNAINFDTDVLGQVTIIGPGAGKRETGFALLSDLIDINLKKGD